MKTTMTRHAWISILSGLLMIFATSAAFAAGGMKGRGGGGGGASRSAPSRSAPSRGGGAATASRPSTPNLGGGASRSNASPGSRPSTSRPAVSSPAARPTPSRPAAGASQDKSRPATSQPKTKLPSGGLKPSTGVGGGDRPAARPDTGVGKGPSTRPSVPNLGGGANKKPGETIANRPNATLPGTNSPGAGRPATANRPAPGDVSDFLGMDKPIRPVDSGSRPGASGPGSNLANRPADRGNVADRSNLADRAKVGDRNTVNNIKIGDVNVGNSVINNRPTWANIDRNQINNINSRWSNQLGGMNDWGRLHPNRVDYWRGWGQGVRTGWDYGRYRSCFTSDWWGHHPHGLCGWHYGYAFGRHPSNYWWTIPTFVACTRWFTWSPRANVWSQPVFYDYGQGGNVTYENNVVYINGEQIASADEFAQSAAVLATVPPPASEQEAEQIEWMPLGTFAVAADEKDVDPTRVIQLAVSKEGIISGTLYNTETDQAQSVQGQVDKETQRVAFRVGESDDIIVESGLYNLTQEDAPVLVHFGSDRVEDWLLVRIETPAEE